MSIEETLATVALFEGLTDEEVARIAAIGRVEYFARDATLFSEGEEGPRLLVVLEGRVDILRADPSGVKRSVGVSGPGEVLGEVSLLLELPRSATVRALEDLKCFTMNRNAFQDMVDDGDPAALKLGIALARGLATRLLTLNDRVLGLLAEGDRGRSLHDVLDTTPGLFRLL
jgi:CRP/FNR family transcriptional regulator